MKFLGLRKRDFLRFMGNGFRWKPIEPTIEQLLVHLEKLDKANLEFWSEYQAHLATEREKRLDDIKAALWESRSRNILLETCGRIVDTAFNDTPLSSAGSLIRAGRFNFARISSYHQDFEALYVADSYDTAYHEKFHVGSAESTGEGELSGPELSTRSPGSFSFFRVNIFLENALDLRKPESLHSFCEVISGIEPTEELIEKGRSIGRVAATIKDPEVLMKLILENNYPQWSYWLDQPSHSQWLAHYARLSGLHAIIYPSCRNTAGYNAAIFPGSLLETESGVELIDKAASVQEKDRFLNKYVTSTQLELPIYGGNVGEGEPSD